MRTTRWRIEYRTQIESFDYYIARRALPYPYAPCPSRDTRRYSVIQYHTAIKFSDLAEEPNEFGSLGFRSLSTLPPPRPPRALPRPRAPQAHPAPRQRGGGGARPHTGEGKAGQHTRGLAEGFTHTYVHMHKIRVRHALSALISGSQCKHAGLRKRLMSGRVPAAVQKEATARRQRTQ